MNGTAAERGLAWQRTWDRLSAPVADEDERKIAAVERAVRKLALPAGFTLRDFALTALFYLWALEEGLANEDEIAATVWAALDRCDEREALR